MTLHRVLIHVERRNGGVGVLCVGVACGCLWADGVRRLIGFRPPSDWIASAVRLDCVRRLIGLRSPSDDFF